MSVYGENNGLHKFFGKNLAFLRPSGFSRSLARWACKKCNNNNNNNNNGNLLHPTSGEPKALIKTMLHERKQRPQQYFNFCRSGQCSSSFQLCWMCFQELNPTSATTRNSLDAKDMANKFPINVPETRPVHSVQILQDGDDEDFIEDSKPRGGLSLDSAVHSDIVPMFAVIGDLFDDDDLG